MAHKYIVDSVCHWAREYHVDGFRFDLMGVLDVDTLNDLSAQLRRINPAVVLYGEGWTGGASPLPEYRRAVKKNVRLLEGFGTFSDDIRDTIRGPVFYNQECGFVGGKPDYENAVRYSAAGAVWHPQVDYGTYYFTPGGPWAENPCEVISYASCHDNLTLWDRLAVSCPGKNRKIRYAMNRLAAAMVFTAQGTPFFLSGEEFARTKPIEKSRKVSDNSYNLPLYTNALRWDWNEEQRRLLEYYRGLIAFRKAHSGLRLVSGKEVRTHLRFVCGLPKQVVAFTIRQKTETLFIVYNAGEKPLELALPDAETWELYIDGEHAGTQPLATAKKTAAIAAVSCCVFVKPVNGSPC
jgi:pullulanase